MKFKTNTFILFCCIIFVAKANADADDKIIVDSQIAFAEAIKGTKAPDSIIKTLTLLDVEYYSFDGNLHRGQLVICKELSADIKHIFKMIKDTKFPISKAIPIIKYDWNDTKSMSDDNTSAFNYRVVAGTKKISNHAYGRAIDINPFLNPYRSASGKYSPPNSKRNLKAAGTFSDDHAIVKEFLKLGWKWGGDYKSIKDWQHFDKSASK